MPPARPPAIIPLRSVTVLANNDHCPADTRPLEIISGHKSLPFHFKAPLPRRPAASFHGKRETHEGGEGGRGEREDVTHAAMMRSAGVISLESAAAFMRLTPLNGRTCGCIFVTCEGVINAPLIAFDVNSSCARARSSSPGHNSREREDRYRLMKRRRGLLVVVLIIHPRSDRSINCESFRPRHESGRTRLLSVMILPGGAPNKIHRRR